MADQCAAASWRENAWIMACASVVVRDQAVEARLPKALFVVQAWEAEEGLPGKVELTSKPRFVKNSFSQLGITMTRPVTRQPS